MAVVADTLDARTAPCKRLRNLEGGGRVPRADSESMNRRNTVNDQTLTESRSASSRNDFRVEVCAPRSNVPKLESNLDGVQILEGLRKARVVVLKRVGHEKVVYEEPDTNLVVSVRCYVRHNLIVVGTADTPSLSDAGRTCACLERIIEYISGKDIVVICLRSAGCHRKFLVRRRVEVDL